MENDVRMPPAPQIRAVSDAWRVLGHLGLLDTIFNHISSVVADPFGKLQIILNPAALLPHELRPEHLCILPLQNYLPSDAAKLGINPDGLHLHALIHCVRMRPGAVIHTHSRHCIAVGCSEQGLLPLSQTAMEFVGDLEVVEYGGVFRSYLLTEQLKTLANRGGVALLRNHGALVVADTIPEAVYLAYFLEEACRIQVVTLSQGVPIVLPPESVIAEARQALRDDRIKVAGWLFDALCRQLEV
jgi:ribulose-5-phosphate 4-epimerase/fuculose-1-phosphate aldolase